MAGFISNLFLLTIQYMILDCAERTLKLLYKPYGPKMCRQLCEDLGGTFDYVPEDLACHRIPRNDSLGATDDSLKHCIMKDMSRNHSPALPLKTRLSACNKQNKDIYESYLQHLTTGDTHGRDIYAGNRSYTLSLHQACEEGNLCQVQCILSQRPGDINARDKLGRTPVMAAVMNHMVTVFDFLVSQSCDLMAADNNNDTVLHVACGVGNVDIVRKLVNHTCDIESRGRKGRTPVMCSALHGHTDVLDLLVSKYCNITTVDNNMNNILHVACSGGHVDMVRYVLRKLNSDIESRGEKGRTPLLIASHRGHTGVFSFLAGNGSNLFAVDDNKDNILHVACMGGHVDMVQHILTEKLINIESRGKFSRTPVMRAAEHGRRLVVDFLASNGCNLTAVDDYTDNLLHVACVGGHVDMVKHIHLKTKIPIDGLGRDGQTPVMIAVRHGHKDVLKYLLSKRCNLGILSKYGDNILHVASSHGRVIIVRYILSKTNISIDSRGQDGMTPVMFAAYYDQESVCMFLVSQGCKLYILDSNKNSILHAAGMGGHVGIVKYILSQTDIPIDRRGQYRRTPVMAAVSLGHVAVVKYLMSKGCKMSMVDINGNNILHLACMSGNVDLVKYILSHTKCEINSRGQYRRMPVMTAASLGHVAVVKYLISKGCKMSMVDISRNNILHLACMSGNEDLVKYILSHTKCGINSRGQYRRMPVMTAATLGHVAVVKYLTSKGCELSTVDIDGNNILHLACLSGKVDLVKYILSHTKLRINSRGQYGRTPAMIAATCGHVSLVKYVKSKGCKLSITDIAGNNILHLACMSDNVDLVKYILSHTKCGINSRGQYRRMPVMIAAYFGRTSVVKYLIGKGCELTNVDEYGRNVLDVACTEHHEDLVKYLISVKSWSKTC